MEKKNSVTISKELNSTVEHKIHLFDEYSDFLLYENE